MFCPSFVTVFRVYLCELSRSAEHDMVLPPHTIFFLNCRHLRRALRVDPELALELFGRVKAEESYRRPVGRLEDEGGEGGDVLFALGPIAHVNDVRNLPSFQLGELLLAPVAPRRSVHDDGRGSGGGGRGGGVPLHGTRTTHSSLVQVRSNLCTMSFEGQKKCQ